MVVVTPRSWPLVCLDISIISYMITFSLMSLSHCAIMWQLRKDFFIGVRSPLLAIMSGVAALIVTDTAVIGRTLDYSKTISTEMLFFVPLSLTFTTAYILRGIRLLALYNPARGSRQGRIKYLKERFFVRVLLAVYLTVEGAVWAFVPKYGVAMVADQMVTLSIMDNLLVIAASAALYRKIRETQDIFSMSTEILTVGRFLMAALVLGFGLKAAFTAGVLDGAPFHICNFVFLAVRFHTAVWHTNIKPVREVLRGNGGQQNRKVSWLPHASLRTSSKVTVGTTENKMAVTSRPPALTSEWARLGPLEHIMSFPLLLAAFTDFCRRALCCEAPMFLKEAASFRQLSCADDADEGACFDLFLAIVGEFIKSGSTFEVNVSGKAKARIMGHIDEAVFRGLDKECRGSIFSSAEKEISQLLEDNLLDKFRATEIYQALAGNLLAMSSERREREGPSLAADNRGNS